ncbi:MAG: hypothetical protein WDM77_03705 [Steroidobacteraceae bacterium]
MFHGPVATDVRLTIGEAQRTFRDIERLGLELIVAIHHGRIAELEILRVAGIGICSVGVPVDFDVHAYLEHLGGPAGTPHQPGRTHLAANVRLDAFFVDCVDFHVRVRVDQVNLGEGFRTSALPRSYRTARNYGEPAQAR